MYKIGIVSSILLNIILGIILFRKYHKDSPGENVQLEADSLAIRQRKAEIFVRNTICEWLYYPNTYDPVKTTIDSVFVGPLTDPECVNAAAKLIDLRSQYSSTQSAYNEAIDHIRFFGRTDFGTSHWGKDRDEAKAQMKQLQEKIENMESIIKNRNTSRDGEFIGWQVTHRYRAANQNGNVSFGDYLFILNPEITKCYFIYPLEEGDGNMKSLKSIRAVIEGELGLYKN